MQPIMKTRRREDREPVPISRGSGAERCARVALILTVLAGLEAALWTAPGEAACDPPLAPVLVSPAAEAQGIGKEVALSWLPSPGATDYEVFIGQLDPPGMPAGTTTSTEFIVTELEPLEVYTWMVAARTDCGDEVASSESEIRAFATGGPPSVSAGDDQYVETAELAVLGGEPTASRGKEPYTFEWTVLSGNGGSLDTSDPANPIFQATRDGEFVCEVTVTDANGFGSAPDNVSVTVCEPILELTSGTVTSAETRRGCLEITAGGAYGISETGRLTLEAPQVGLENGFQVAGELFARHPAVDLDIVSVDRERAHRVAAGSRTTFVLSLENDTAAPASVRVEIDSVATDPRWVSELFHADERFQPIGTGGTTLDISLAPDEEVLLIGSLGAPAELADGDTGTAEVTVSRAGFIEASAELRAVVRNRPKVYFVAIDGLGPRYLEMDRRGRLFDGAVERLMSRAKAFTEESAYLPNSVSFLPASTDVDHTAAIGGSWPGTLGIPSIRRYYAGTSPDGDAEFLFVAKELLRYGPDGSPIRTIFDQVKDPAAGGSPDLFNAFFSGKEWVGDLYRDDVGTVDIIAGGQQYPFYNPAPSPFRLGDPISDPDAETDEEGTVLRRGMPLKAINVGSNPQAFPEDRWIAEAAIRTISAEDPDVLYVLLAETDTSQHIWGAADNPEEWSDEGTPEVIWDDINVYNGNANRDPILDIVHEADVSFGLILDVLSARGMDEHSVVVLLSDHKLITAMSDPLFVGEILLGNGVLVEDVEFMLSRHSNTFIYLTDSTDAPRVEAILEAYEVMHPVLGELVHPFIVVDREEMDSGVDNVEGLMMEDGIPHNKKGELYSEWSIDFPVEDTSKVKWPHLILFNRYRFQNALIATQDISGGIRGPETIGTHSTPETASVPIAIRGPGVAQGLYENDASLADIAPTLYRILGIATPEHVDGRALDLVLTQEMSARSDPED